MTDIVRVEKVINADDTLSGVTTVTLNSPDNLNALSTQMRETLTGVFEMLKTDTDTLAIVLTGSGRAFTAGLDLKELGQKGMNTDANQGSGQGSKQGSQTTDLQKAVRSVGKPVIGAINGFAITGGFELALACDILIAADTARFADTHVRMGVVPGWGLSQRLSRLIGVSRAKELSFTGNFLDAATAERWGLVNSVHSPDELMPYCLKLAHDIVSVHQDTLREVHRLIDLGWESTLAEGLEAERDTSRRQNQNLAADALEQNRLAVQSRGRDQQEN